MVTTTYPREFPLLPWLSAVSVPCSSFVWVPPISMGLDHVHLPCETASMCPGRSPTSNACCWSGFPHTIVPEIFVCATTVAASAKTAKVANQSLHLIRPPPALRAPPVELWIGYSP